MKHIGNLKKQVEKAETKNEKKSLIENAGMLLNDDELEMVAGGVNKPVAGIKYSVFCKDTSCGFRQDYIIIDEACRFVERTKFCPWCNTSELDVKIIPSNSR